MTELEKELADALKRSLAAINSILTALPDANVSAALAFEIVGAKGQGYAVLKKAGAI